jgi:hypothetical protein
MMARWRRLTLAGLVMGVLCAPLSASAAETLGPRLTVSPNPASPGESVEVFGSHFPERSDVQAQICGNRADDGSADCDLTTSQEVSTTPGGLFQLSLAVAVPPTPCPCVVMITGANLNAIPTTPIVIVGAPSAIPTELHLLPLQIRHVALQGDGPWYAWFGGTPKRMVALTVHNPNRTAYDSPPLVLSARSTKGVSLHEATSRVLPSIGPGKTRTYIEPISFSVLSIGEHHVYGYLGNAGFTSRFVEGTWLFPWALAIVILVVLEVLLLAFTGHLRRKRRRENRTMTAELPLDYVALTNRSGDWQPTGGAKVFATAYGMEPIEIEVDDVPALSSQLE